MGVWWGEEGETGGGRGWEVENMRDRGGQVEGRQRRARIEILWNRDPFGMSQGPDTKETARNTQE